MEIVIASSFCGPANSGNGGYTCGRMAAFIDGACEVTLRAPPPLDTPLRVEREVGKARLLHGEQLIAEAAAINLDVDPPGPPDWKEAQAAEAAFGGKVHHDYPQCFTCGTARKAGDGLRVSTGPVAGREIVAATWVPNVDLADSGGSVRPEFLWAATDCAGAWANASANARHPVLGRYAARFLRRLTPGDRCIVIGWPLGSEGRKHHAGTALFTADGELVGCGRQTWIELAEIKKPPPNGGG